ncbi:MAG: phytanoyl-CoA dioxygenase family protein [Pirellulales bacterium]|nr:phytanoyl-CoA dioxygenase family protein [Pirellulales bacterium]
MDAAELKSLSRDGFVLLAGVFARAEVDDLAADLDRTLEQRAEAAGSILTRSRRVYAARNLLTVWPRALQLTANVRVAAALDTILGPRWGLVRGLLFDKPPEQSWSLPWHQDLTIAVAQHRDPPGEFSKPTLKAGVAHVEASREVLERMVTARIHLDDVTLENGPLRVLPGSHAHGKSLAFDEVGTADGPRPHTVLARAGDVLLMRPLLAHSSIAAEGGTHRHRRILHLEFADSESLPNDYRWHTFARCPRGQQTIPGVSSTLS